MGVKLFCCSRHKQRQQDETLRWRIHQAVKCFQTKLTYIKSIHPSGVCWSLSRLSEGEGGVIATSWQSRAGRQTNRQTSLCTQTPAGQFGLSSCFMCRWEGGRPSKTGDWNPQPFCCKVTALLTVSPIKSSVTIKSEPYVYKKALRPIRNRCSGMEQNKKIK